MSEVVDPKEICKGDTLRVRDIAGIARDVLITQVVEGRNGTVTLWIEPTD